MDSGQAKALSFAASVHVVRFGVILGGLELGPLIGIDGWYTGLFVNVLCVAFAAGLVTYLGLWSRIGARTLWRGRLAALLLLVPLTEALLWLAPDGLDDRAPGAGLWALSLLLVGVNEGSSVAESCSRPCGAASAPTRPWPSRPPSSGCSTCRRSRPAAGVPTTS